MGKNTTDVLQTHNVDKTCILPAGILALVIRHAYRILSATHYIVLCVLSSCTIFFPHYRINGTFSGGKNIIEHESYVSIVSKNFVQNTSHFRSIHQDIIVNVHWCSYQLFLSDFNKT